MRNEDKDNLGLIIKANESDLKEYAVGCEVKRQQSRDKFASSELKVNRELGVLPPVFYNYFMRKYGREWFTQKNLRDFFETYTFFKIANKI